MKSIYMASILGNINSHIFVNDIHREIESTYSELYLSLNLKI